MNCLISNRIVIQTFHDINLTAGWPCRSFRQHPDGRPCSSRRIQLGTNLNTPVRKSLFAFCIHTAAATIYGIRQRTGLWGVDLILFGTAGIAGCILAFLALFSEHPAVSSNFLLFVFHPGQLLFLPYIIYCVRKGKKCWYLTLNLIILTLFIVLFPVIPQRFDFAVVPLALCLLIRSVSNLIVTSKKK